MFETICALPLSSELFAQAIHPSEPIIAVGLSSGHVQSFRLPTVSASSDDEDGNASILSTGTGTIETEWRTRRHKGSCRCLGYSGDGQVLYSAGTDGLLKAASSTTGQVISKIVLPNSLSAPQPDPPTLLYALSPQTMLVATDSSALHLYDLRSPSSFSSDQSNPRPAQTHHPHDDYISSLTPLPPSASSASGFSRQWVTTGGTTLAVTDLRRGVLVKSEDQEEELLCSVYVHGLAGRGTGEKVLVGSGSGVLTLWERGHWEDQGERIIVDGGRGGGESLDCFAVMPTTTMGSAVHVCVGLGDGTVRVVRLGTNKVVGEPLRHDELEGVVGLGFDVAGRMISGGGHVVKVWQEEMDRDDDEDEEEEDEEESGEQAGAGVKKRRDDGSDESSEDEDSRRGRKKKRRKGGKGGNNKGVLNGIVGFKDMD